MFQLILYSILKQRLNLLIFQMFAILDNFKKNVEVEERESAPHQIVAVGVHWSRHIDHLVREFMKEPYVVITALEEAALYGNVQQVMGRGWWAHKRTSVC